MNNEEAKGEVEVKEEVKPKQEEVKSKQEEVKEEVKPVAKTIQITNPKDGQIYDLTPQEVIDLATHGLMSSTDEPKKMEKLDETTEERVDRLEKDLKQRDDLAKSDKQAAAVMNEINSCAQKFALTKEGGTFSDNVKLLTLVRVNQNPRLNIAETFAQETKKIMDELEDRTKKTDATKAVKDSMEGGSMRSGSLPTIDTSKEYGPKDLLGTGSREAMRKFLEQQE